MSPIKIKIVLFINYFVFAILLNSVGIVILQVQQNFGVVKSEASVLEAFKDLPIAICSFLFASFLPKFGIKRSMQVGLLVVSLICFVVPFQNTFLVFKLLFCLVGFSFALIKISVFTTIGLVSNSNKEHSSLMAYLESCFMIGVLFGNLLFSFFVVDNDPKSTNWLNVYWIIGTMSLLSLLFLSTTKLDESAAKIEGQNLMIDIKNSLILFTNKRVYIFLICAFLFVLIEQSFQTWTPTFYKDTLRVPTSMSIQAGAILAGAFAVGRLLSGFVSKSITWIYIVVFCVVGFIISVCLVLPLSHHSSITDNMSWLNAPLVIYLFPLMGCFLAPIYPILNSTILSSIPKYLHSSMAGLIVVFSAVGGSFGSIITGNIFEKFEGVTAFYFSLVPLVLLLIFALLFNNLNSKNNG